MILRIPPIAAVCVLVADGMAGAALPDWLNIAGNASAMAVLAWYAWYTTSKAIPSMIRQFRDESKEQRESCEKEHEISRERESEHLTAFREELKETRTNSIVCTRQLTEAVKSLEDSWRRFFGGDERRKRE